MKVKITQNLPGGEFTKKAEVPDGFNIGRALMDSRGTKVLYIQSENEGILLSVNSGPIVVEKLDEQ